MGGVAGVGGLLGKVGASPRLSGAWQGLCRFPVFPSGRDCARGGELVGAAKLGARDGLSSTFSLWLIVGCVGLARPESGFP